MTTYAVLTVSRTTFNEIANKLVKAGYQRNLVEHLLTMDGLALVAEDPRAARAAVHSMPDCPFHYCDSPAPRETCAEQCRYRSAI